MASESFETHAAKYHRETCNGSQHWVLCSNPESFERTQTLIPCPPGCKRSPSSSNGDFPIPKKSKDDGSHENTSTDADSTYIILQRHYALNQSGSKSLQIGILITSDLEPEIVFTLADNTRNKKIIFNLQVWQNWLMNDQFLTDYLSNGQLPLNDSEMNIPLNKTGDKYLICRKMYNKHAIIFSSVTDKAVNIAMMQPTYLYMRKCIPAVQNVVQNLLLSANNVKQRATQFVEQLATAKEENVCEESDAKVIIENRIDYDSESLIDCELTSVGLQLLLKIADKMVSE